MMKRKKNSVEDSATLIALSDHPDQTYGSMEACAAAQENMNVFSDGVTRIDFVLVWEESVNPLKLGESDELSSGSSRDTHRKWRTEFLSKLRTAGLHQETKEVVQGKTKTTYVLLSAPWNVLCYYAEEISLRVPLQVVTTPISNWSERILEKLHIPNIMAQDVPNLPPDYYTCQFRSNKLERFLGHENKDTFFKTTQRHQILYEILARTPYGSLKRGEVGIGRLVSENVLTAAFPLHEGPSEMPKTPIDPQSLNMRQILHHYWASWASWRKYQPLDHIREYFGEKIALYFAWLGFYTGWLLPAAVVGFIIFLFGVWLMVTDVAAEELCSSGDTFVMCPLCNICSYWNLSSICYTYKAGLLFDNGGTVFFSIFMSLWAVTFLEYWKRTSSILSHRWDCSEFEEIEERPRPEFTALAPMMVRNPVTGSEEPYFPETQRLSRTLTGNMVIVLMISIVLIFLIAIILYRTILSIIIYRSQNAFFIFSAGRIASLTGSMLNLLVILVLSRLYTYLAQILTRWEMHRTQTKYENAFILKVFIFQFVNFYSSPVYIAFFKGRFVGYPGNYNTLLGIRNEDCGASGCLIELAQELLVIMVGKQVISNIQEFVLPKLKTWWHRRKLKPAPSQEVIDEPDSKPDLSPWEANYQLLVCEGLFDEYLEMDYFDRKAFLIAFTSDFLPRLFYRYTTGSMSGYINFTLSVAPGNFTQSHMTCRYRGLRDDKGQATQDYYHLLAIRLSFVIIFEHVVLLIGRIIDWMVPDIPEEVEIKIKREHYMAKEALAENQSMSKTVLEDMERQISELRHRGRGQSLMNSISSPSSPSPEHEDKPTAWQSDI
ncbi:anoctamin-7 [Garra rufa]|uniref:anoctamin-7 n=1 Tax=Garra rufa TaxID=137080 RepID=UPI003CCEEE9F